MALPSRMTAYAGGAAPRPPAAGELDVEMQASSIVLPHGGGWLMFYNANLYGRLGFGCAAAERVS